MNVARFTTAQDFSQRALAFLLEHEVEHNVILGLVTALAYKPDLYPSQPSFAVVEEAGAVIAAAVMTPPHRLVLSLNPSQAALETLARDVHAFRPETPGVVAPVPASRHFAEIWQALTGRRFQRSLAERLYVLERVTPPANASGRMRRVTEADRPLLREWLIAFQREALGEAEVDPETVERVIHNTFTLPPEFTGTFLWEDPQPVSLTRYGGPTPNSMRLGPVYTPPEFRQRGYASACVAAVSQHLLDSGRKFCTLFTDLTNPTSNKIYQQVGYRPVCDVDEYQFIV